MKNYDVIVVGAGPSGATAARWCAKNGFSTLLIDKNKFPRDKPCGGAVSSRALKQLNFNIDEVVQQVYCTAKIYRPRGDFLFLESNTPLAVGVIRADFDFLLVQKAISEGTIFKEKETVEDVLVSSSGVNIKCNSGFDATGEILVAADGVNGTVAKRVGIRKRWNPNEVGLARVWESKIGENTLKKLMLDCLEFYLGITLAGYGWIFPKGDYLSVGTGILMKELRTHKDLNRILMIRKLRALEISNPRSCLVPIGGVNRRICSDRLLFVGDAAGLVDPLFGEGIHYAISSGRIAALSIRKGVESGRPEDSSVVYDKLCKQTLVSDLRFAYSFAKKVYYHPDLVLGFLLSDKKLGQAFTEVVKGEKTYRDFVMSTVRRIPISTGKRFVDQLRNRKMH